MAIGIVDLAVEILVIFQFVMLVMYSYVSYVPMFQITQLLRIFHLQQIFVLVM